MGERLRMTAVGVAADLDYSFQASARFSFCSTFNWQTFFSS